MSKSSFGESNSALSTLTLTRHVYPPAPMKKNSHAARASDTITAAAMYRRPGRFERKPLQTVRLATTYLLHPA